MDTKVKYSSLEEKEEILRKLYDQFKADTVTNKQIAEFVQQNNLPYPYFLQTTKGASQGWGKYKIVGLKLNEKVKRSKNTGESNIMNAVVEPVEHIDAPVISVIDNYIPRKDSTYIPFGFFKNLKKIVSSKIFYPVYITGLSGNGKTLMVEQVCASLGREMIRVNITKDTDELDLIGSYELIDGNTIRKEGPVITAMKRGAVLLLDETDYGSERILCLQPILEGKAFFDKKTGNTIHPAHGFNIIATANTKGRGNDDGKYIGANILNEAFLERFAITVEQDYPPLAIEKQILKKNFQQLNINDDMFIFKLSNWADTIRRAYKEDAIEEVLTTRRLVHIAKAYAIFEDRKEAIELCLNRFDATTKDSFMDLYAKIDETINEEKSICTEKSKDLGDVMNPIEANQPDDQTSSMINTLVNNNAASINTSLNTNGFINPSQANDLSKIQELIDNLKDDPNNIPDLI